jgi:hypothetical protein
LGSHLKQLNTKSIKRREGKNLEIVGIEQLGLPYLQIGKLVSEIEDCNLIGLAMLS